MNLILVIISQHPFSSDVNPQGKDLKVFWAERVFPSKSGPCGNIDSLSFSRCFLSEVIYITLTAGTASLELCLGTEWVKEITAELGLITAGVPKLFQAMTLYSGGIITLKNH